SSLQSPTTSGIRLCSASKPWEKVQNSSAAGAACAGAARSGESRRAHSGSRSSRRMVPPGALGLMLAFRSLREPNSGRRGLLAHLPLDAEGHRLVGGLDRRRALPQKPLLERPVPPPHSHPPGAI